MSEKLNARSTTYRVADDVIYDPREGDVFRMGNNWECVVLGRVADDGFDCVRFCSVVGATRTERTINLNEWIDRCVGEEIERQMPHHARSRTVVHVAQFPHRASESGADQAVSEASGKLADQVLDDVLVLLAGQKYPTPERGYKTDGGWSLALADLGRCFAELRSKLATAEAERDRALAGVENMERIRIGLEAERDAARDEVGRLREDAARNRWCEEKKADVNYGFHSGGVYVHEWFVQWDGIGTVHYVRHPDRSAAIDAARGEV